jgi:hypothetical protein
MVVKDATRGFCPLQILSAALFSCPLAALAGPPFVTDDPEPAKYRHWEVYIAYQFTFGPHFFSKHRAPSLWSGPGR